MPKSKRDKVGEYILIIFCDFYYIFSLILYFRPVDIKSF